MSVRSDRFLPAMLFSSLLLPLLPPLRCTLLDKFTPSSLHLLLPLPLPSSFLSLSHLLHLHLLLRVPPVLSLCTILPPPPSPSSPLTSPHSLGVNPPVHSPVPYCGAVHHLHAFSILQQNEFLIGPETQRREEREEEVTLSLFFSFPFFFLFLFLHACRHVLLQAAGCDTNR